MTWKGDAHRQLVEVTTEFSMTKNIYKLLDSFRFCTLVGPSPGALCSRIIQGKLRQTPISLTKA
jgi:hypothetical protein